MTKQNYAEKLQNPLWQRKRLEILQRDNFRCTEVGCFDDKTTLHIHHLDYIKGAEPWEYPDEYLTTLCKNCHEDVTKERPVHEKDLITNFRLKLKDTFIQGCAVEIFKTLSSEELHDIIFMLWELNRHHGNLSKLVNDLYQVVNCDTEKKVQEILAKKEGENG